ncbi:DUF2471 family protein (plasmid) [Burkholderia pyrrocinia]|uniref:DUF2471 family protein n=1 Tax=Burkholderia pyrrocinia TaxID=60550 RepID=UPI0038B66BF7
MNLAPTANCHDPDFDPVRYEHALELATDDLRRIVTLLVERYLSTSLAHGLSWPVLVEIEEQAFSDLAFQSRNDATIIDALPRIGSATMLGVDLTGLIDWSQSDPSLPIVYRCAREALFAAPASQLGEEAV